MEGGIRGLVIVFSAFMIQVLIFGNFAIVGLYTVHFLEEFDGKAIEVSFISAIHCTVVLAFGPITSVMMGRFTARTLCLVGAFLVSGGIFCVPLLIYLPAIYLSFGVFAGLGGCLVYLPSHIMCGLYYDEYRSLAVGIATAGQGMGAIVLPLIVGFLIEEYTWKGSLLILCGIDLHLFIFALLMVPPPEYTSVQDVHDVCNALHLEDDHEYCRKPSLKEVNRKSTFAYNTPDNRSDDTDPDHNLAQFELQSSHIESTVESAVESPVDSAVLEIARKANKRKRRKTAVFCTTSLHNVRLQRKNFSRLSIYLEGRLNIHRISDSRTPNTATPSYLSKRSFAVDNYYSRRSVAVDNYYSRRSVAVDLPANLYTPKNKDLDTENTVTDVSAYSPASSGFAFHQPSTLNTTDKRVSIKEIEKSESMLLSFQFIIYFLSTLLWSSTISIFLTFGPDFLVKIGNSGMDTAFLFALNGFGQFFGCIVVSVLGNFVAEHRMLLYIMSNVLLGISMFAVPFFSEFMEMALLLSTLGLMYGGILGLYMIVMVDIVGVDDMDIGLGYTMLGSGIGSFIGPPVGGALLQKFGNYDLSFFIAGGITILAGLVMLPTYPICKCNRSVMTQEKTASQ